MKKNLNSVPLVRKTRQTGPFRFATASPIMLFRTFILFGALVVASIAILHGTTDPSVWAFLGSVIIYAALKNEKGNPD